MKSFSEFKSTISVDDMEHIFNVYGEHENTPIDLTNPNWATELAMAATKNNYKANLRLLELYHEWLTKELDK